MNEKPDNNHLEQNLQIHAGRDVKSVNGNLTSNTSINILSGNLISFILVGVLAGGAAIWALGIRITTTGIEFNTQLNQPKPKTSQPPLK